MDQKQVCVVIGVGPGNGAAFAERFAREGYRVALLARGRALTDPLAARLEGARAYACDVSDAAAVDATFAAIEAEMGAPAVVVYNADAARFGGFEEVTIDDFEAAWRANALGLFLVARRIAPGMRAAGGGSLLITGATASRRGVPRTAAFAPAKAAQRSLAESLARTLWPAGIHVALIVIDGVVDLPRTRAWFKDKPDSFFVKPDDVAGIALHLARQPRSAWSFEVEARPFGETW